MILSGEVVILFGGVAEEFSSAHSSQSYSTLLNDLHILNIREYHWIQPITGGIIPSPRYGHSLCPGDESNKVYVFGGITEDFTFAVPELYLLYETSKQSDKNWKIVEDLDFN